MSMRDIFKTELPKYMKKAGMKQIDLAKALGKSKSTVHCWLSGKAFPEIDTIQAIADVLGCKTDDLVRETVTDTIVDWYAVEKLNQYEVALISAFRDANPIIRKAALKMLQDSAAYKGDDKE